MQPKPTTSRRKTRMPSYCKLWPEWSAFRSHYCGREIPLLWRLRRDVPGLVTTRFHTMCVVHLEMESKRHDKGHKLTDRRRSCILIFLLTVDCNVQCRYEKGCRMKASLLRDTTEWWSGYYVYYGQNGMLEEIYKLYFCAWSIWKDTKDFLPIRNFS